MVVSLVSKVWIACEELPWIVYPS